MNRLSIIDELGDHVPLLMKTDDWLEARRASISQKVSELFSELRIITAAQRIKRQLQQTNYVAVACSDDYDRVIRIMPLPDAIRQVTGEVNRNEQLNHWRLDGYDIEAASMMR